MTVEQGKGELCDDPLTNNGQRYQVDRAFGVMVDSFKISGSDSILEGEVTLKAHGVFQRGKLISNESAEAAPVNISNAVWAAGIATITATTHGLSV